MERPSWNPARRGSARRSNTCTGCPRWAKYKDSKEPTKPAPITVRGSTAGNDEVAVDIRNGEESSVAAKLLPP